MEVEMSEVKLPDPPSRRDDAKLDLLGETEEGIFEVGTTGEVRGVQVRLRFAEDEEILDFEIPEELENEGGIVGGLAGHTARIRIPGSTRITRVRSALGSRSRLIPPGETHVWYPSVRIDEPSNRAEPEVTYNQIVAFVKTKAGNFWLYEGGQDDNSNPIYIWTKEMFGGQTVFGLLPLRYMVDEAADGRPVLIPAARITDANYEAYREQQAEGQPLDTAFNLPT